MQCPVFMKMCTHVRQHPLNVCFINHTKIQRHILHIRNNVLLIHTVFDMRGDARVFSSLLAALIIIIIVNVIIIQLFFLLFVFSVVHTHYDSRFKSYIMHICQTMYLCFNCLHME